MPRYGTFDEVSLEESIEGIVKKDVHAISGKSFVMEAASLMLRKNVSCLIVFEGKNVTGIVTERDILRKVTAVGADPKKILVERIMSTKLISTTYLTTIGDAAKKMIENNIRRLVVLREDGAFVGLITMTDLIRWIARQEELSDSLINYLMYKVP